MAQAKISDQRITSTCLIILSAFAITMALYFLRPIMVPFVISVFLFFCLSPIVGFIQTRLKLPRALSMLLALVAGVVLASLVLVIFSMSIQNFLAGAGVYQQKLEIISGQVLKGLEELGFSFAPDNIKAMIRELPLANWAKGVTGNVFGFLGDSVLVVIFVAFLMGGQDPTKEMKVTDSKMGKGVRKYIVSKVLLSFVTAVLVGITLAIIGLEMAFMFAVLAFFLNFIPNLGSIIAVATPLPIAFMQFGVGMPFWLVLIIPGVIQFGIGNILEPRVMGESMGLHPVTVLFALVFWGMVWGIAGMFLAVPVTAIIKLILQRLEPTKPIARLMAGDFS